MLDKTAILKEVQKHLAKGAIDKAIAELDKLLKDSPDGNTYNMVGDLYLKKGSRKAATDHYQKAANFFWHEGFVQKAQALYKKILNIDPANTDAMYAFGELSEEKGLATDAIKYYLATADILAKEGKKEKLLDIYEKILSLSPANIPLRMKVAEIFIREGLKSDAAKEYLIIARIHNEKDEFQKAREFFQKAIDNQPLNKEAALGLSDLYEKTGELRQAMEYIKDATVLFPGDIDILFRCAELALLSDNAGGARDCLTRIIEKDPGNIKARKTLGELFLKAGALEKAWEQYLPVLDDVLINREYDDAIALLETFKSLDPVETGKRLVSLYKQLVENDKACDELVALGDTYASRGLEDDAKSCYTEALQIKPDHVQATQRLASPAPSVEPEPQQPLAAGMEMPQQASFASHVAEVEEGPEHITVSGEKPFDEVIAEADIFSRYGLLNEAQRLLEDLRTRFPESIEVHLRLKTLYSEINDKEAAVTECLILSELYKRMGNSENSELELNDAFEINPEDPRLAERGFAHLIEQTSLVTPQAEDFGEAAAPEAPDFEDYEEEIAEADFYARQGLTTEAFKILERLRQLFPENRDVHDRLQALGQIVPGLEGGEMPETFELPETDEDLTAFELSEGFEKDEGIETPGGPQQPEAVEMPERTELFKSLEQGEKVGEQVSAGPSHEPAPGETAPPASEAHRGVPEAPQAPAEYEVFSLSDSDLVDAQEMPEPALDDDVLEIFQEFKKGLEKELGDEDSETHYNLGIAYKEMGLIDDAINEFQTSRNDPKRFIQSSTMLGICYMEKGLYTLAIDVLSKAVSGLKDKDDAYWAINYELAEAYEKNNNLKEALDLYTAVYGWNAKFRDVSDKMNRVQAQAPKTAEKETTKEKPKERKDRVSYL